ncbi:MAG: FHA domain-containing protein [Gammaproteobacteria bacterium]
MAKVITIGRSNNNDIVLAYPQISRVHAEISLVDRDKFLFRLKDMDTLNGTYKNGKKIKEEVFDSQNDKIMVGHINIRPSLYLPYFFDETPEIPVEGDKTRVPLESVKEIKGSDTVLSPSETIEGLENREKPASARVIAVDIAGAPKRRFRWMETLSRANLPVYFLTFVVGAGFATVVSSGFSESLTYSLVGYCALAAFLLSIAYSSIESRNRFAYQKSQQAMSLEILNEKVSALRLQRVEIERSQYAWSGTRKFVVSRKIQECDNVYSIYLLPHDKKLLPQFKPGQYLTLALKIDDRAKPLIRCYSLSCSALATEQFRISVKKLPHGVGSGYLHEKLQEGDILDVRAPSGHFFLDVTAVKPVVLIAGGIGITPILSMVNTLADIGSRREVWIFYGVSNGSLAVQREQLIELASTHPNFHLQICFSRPRAVDPIDNIHVKSRVTVDLLKETLSSNNYEFFICGPGEMMQDLTSGLESWGVPPAHIHFEGFGPASVPHKPVVHTDAQYTVHFSRSNKSCVWTEKSGSLLSLARENNISIDSSCEAGNCGTCIVAIRAGDVSYLSEPGATPEKGSCLTCISVPKGELTLDA